MKLFPPPRFWILPRHGMVLHTCERKFQQATPLRHLSSFDLGGGPLAQGEHPPPPCHNDLPQHGCFCKLNTTAWKNMCIPFFFPWEKVPEGSPEKTCVSTPSKLFALIKYTLPMHLPCERKMSLAKLVIMAFKTSRVEGFCSIQGWHTLTHAWNCSPFCTKLPDMKKFRG